MCCCVPTLELLAIVGGHIKMPQSKGYEPCDMAHCKVSKLNQKTVGMFIIAPHTIRQVDETILISTLDQLWINS